MMLPSHLLATLLVASLASWWRPWPRAKWGLAVLFGVAIDLDHALQFPAYVATHGAAGLTPASMLHWGAAWQGFMHAPWALLPVAGACLALRTRVPAAFWGLHMAQDFVVARHFVVWGSALEWAIVLGLLVSWLGVEWGRRATLARRAPRLDPEPAPAASVSR